MKIARQRVSATKSGNGLQKTLQTISIWRWLLFILFFYFSVVLVVIREKSPEIRGFPRQPARQRDSNRGCNGLPFSERKLHLFCDLHKTVHRFFRRVARVRCRVFTLPALLSAVFGKHSWIREVPPAVNALVHNRLRQPPESAADRNGFVLSRPTQGHLGSPGWDGTCFHSPQSRWHYQSFSHW